MLRVLFMVISWRSRDILTNALPYRYRLYAVLAIAFGLLYPHVSQLWAQVRVAEQCGMKCCQKKSTAACHRLKAGQKAAASLSALPACGGKCSDAPAVLSKFSACINPLDILTAQAPAAAAALRELAPSIASANFDAQRFQRPPPSA